MIKLILFVLALLMLTACTGNRDRSTAAYYGPCKQMKVEAGLAEELKADLYQLNRSAISQPSRPAPGIPADTAAKVTVESLQVQKENLLAMTIQSMQRNAQACALRSQGYGGNLDR